MRKNDSGIIFGESYRMFDGTVDYDDIKKCYCGKILGIKDQITYEADNLNDLYAEFCKVVDAYILDKQGFDACQLAICPLVILTQIPAAIYTSLRIVKYAGSSRDASGFQIF